MTTIKLHVPKDLPEDGLTAVAFEAWQNQTISFLEQEIINYDFISGNYSTWKAKQETEDGKRISSLHADDPDKIALEAKTGAEAERVKPAERTKLLAKRNSQLTKFLQLIANMCQYSEQSDVMNISTSLSWIWEYLKKHYNIETRGSHILDIAAINPKPDQKPIVFYKQFRAGFLNNLRKSGDKIMFKGGKRLQENETISPTYECTIMMWALEKLDPRLPSKVKKDFGFRMEGDITLMDLQTDIFQAVPGMIEEMDETAEAKAIFVGGDDEDEDPVLSAINSRQNRGFGAYRGRGGGSQGQKRPYKPPFGKSGQTGRGDTGPSCRVCKLAGKSDYVCRSHTVGTCKFYTAQEQSDIVAHKLNSLQVTTKVDTGADSPFYDMEEEDGNTDD